MKMFSFQALFIAVILLGTLHMIAPDHWLPLSAIARRFKYTRYKIQGTATILGGLHSGISVMVGLIASIIDIIFISYFRNGFSLIGAVLLLSVAIYFFANGYRESRSGHLDVQENGTVKSALVVSIFPDFAVIPFIILTVDQNLISAMEIIAAFILASIVSLNAMAYIGTKGLAKIIERVPPYYIDYLMGLILLFTILFV